MMVSLPVFPQVGGRMYHACVQNLKSAEVNLGPTNDGRLVCFFYSMISTANGNGFLHHSRLEVAF